ncbi:MAG: hypothetical protein PVJ27_06670 [Candidatus Brocadiaceae bacterium]|jgi:hypothetical protein
MVSRQVRAVTAVVVLLLSTATVADEERVTPTLSGPGYVWWEGEDAVSHNFGPHDEWLSEGGAGKLSGGTWLTANVEASPPEGLLATWRVSVPETGSYDLWARVGWRGWCGNDWRFDDGPWRSSPADDSFHQVVHHVQHRPTSWVVFGRVRLERGEHTFQVRLPGDRSVLQGFDCFILAQRPFVPLGRHRPDEGIGQALGCRGEAQGWWPFQPAYFPDAEPSLDLSYMNDPIGSHGFVTMRDGELCFEDGTPVRFWGVNAAYHGGHMIYPSRRVAEMFADHLARLGVNCVRLHVMHSANSLIDDSYGDTQHFDGDRLDRLDYLAAALRERGIYVNLDLMYHRMFREGDEIDSELVGTGRDDDYNVNWAAGSAALFHPRAIELNRALYRKFLQHVNPYTGRRWVDDPQVALLTIQNEQSIFWGTTNIHRGRPRRILNRMYTHWLREKYGSHAELRDAWQVPGEEAPLDADENLDAGLIRLGPVATQSAPNLRRRGLDQLRFLYAVETGFYRDTIRAMREWGVRCPIITSNWRGAGQSTRLVLQASTLGELVDRHYYSGGQQLLSEVGRGTLAAAFDQVAGRGFGVSEWNAGVSGRYVPEVVPLVAIMSAFQGWDAMYHFCPTSPTWETYLKGLNVTAGHYVLYPIAAMIFRRGDVRPGELVYERRRDPAQQFSFHPEEQRVPSEVIAVGRVRNAYVDEPEEDLYRRDLVERCWDKEHAVVHAGTGEFTWHYGRDWLRLNSPRTQGAIGALRGKNIRCADVGIKTPNEYCAVLVTALEKKPIHQAGRLLVAVLGRSQNLASPGGPLELPEGADSDVPPCLMEPVTGQVAVRTDLRTVYALDANGFRLHRVAASHGGGESVEELSGEGAPGNWLTFPLEGEPQVFYYEVTD